MRFGIAYSEVILLKLETGMAMASIAPTFLVGSLFVSCAISEKLFASILIFFYYTVNLYFF
uniref:Uncharacterized protein n=1 Tax=Papilio xuthus TaxID=66420 RepID=I4DQM6_PAPXU|nr:unknown unsecreted protein [Papilio xuthus]